MANLTHCAWCRRLEERRGLPPPVDFRAGVDHEDDRWLRLRPATRHPGAGKSHHHAVIEQVHAHLKNSALAHLPSGVFNANAAWLVLAVLAFNLTRAAGTLAAPDLAKATTTTLRRKLIAVPARVASSARRITLHLPRAWPWETAWTALSDRVADPPPIRAA